MNDLKPCMTCGHDTDKQRLVFEEELADCMEKFVRCTVCWTTALHPDSDPDLNWNTRPGEDAARAEGRREALEEAAQTYQGKYKLLVVRFLKNLANQENPGD